ncbi:MAG: hypothetical protein J6T26_01140 [Firmicutes bacterium]|nr:hypothetical protein [Bacillota bacterium]
MTISSKDWGRYVEALSRISRQAASDLLRFVSQRGGLAAIDRRVLLYYAFALASKYGEASASLAAVWYDELAAAAGQTLPAAQVAGTATYAETAKTVNGVLKVSRNEEMLAGAMERLVKMPGADTTLNNAIRDGAEVAWVPHGDTCAFCFALASRGWVPASRKLVQNGHAEHIHANCDCTYAVRYDDSTRVAGYDPRRYREMYDDAPGGSSTEKINAMRRAFYAENREEINAQKRSAYEKRKELNSSAAEEAEA